MEEKANCYHSSLVNMHERNSLCMVFIRFNPFYNLLLKIVQ